MIPSARDLAFVTILAAAFATAAWAVTAYAGRTRPPAHRATVTWIVDTRAGSAGADPDAYADALVGDELLRAAARTLGQAPTAEAVAALRRELDVDVIGSLVRLRVRATSPEQAERRAEALTTAVQALDADATEARLAARAALDAEIDALEERVRTLQVVGDGGAGGDVAALLEEREALVARRDALAAEPDAAATPALTLEGLDVEAVPPEPSPALAPAIGFAAAVGGVLGFAIVAARRRTMGRADPGGGHRDGMTIPLLAAWEDGDPAPAARGDAAANALHVALLEALPDAWPRVVLLAGVDRTDDVTRVAARLAEEVARSGARVLLVDADLAGPSLAARYGVEAGDDVPASTSDWLMRPEDDHRVLSVDVGRDASLDLVPQVRPTRPAPDFVEEVYAGFPSVLRRWQAYDVIVLRAAPVTEGAETLLLAPHVTGVALVVDDADRETWRRVRRDLQRVGARLAGVVVAPGRSSPGASTAKRHDAPGSDDGYG